ncbi:putative uncharacterized protein DDB_G0271606 [Drosophila navojoa]|nr:putative uncharacterized protein DDB_G0271606 [Drosophila navojoa]
MAPTPPVKIIMKNDCDTNRSTGAVPKQVTTTTQGAALPANLNRTPSTTSTRSSSSRARNSSLIKQQQEQQQRERDEDIAARLQRGTCKTLYDLLERATTAKTQYSSQQQEQREALRQLAAEHSYDPTDQLQEQHHRYCFPVRPVQRVQHQQQPQPQPQSQPQPQPVAAAVLRLRQPTTPNATVGVVTPNTTNGNEEQQPTSTSSTSAIASNSQAPTALQTVVHRLFGVSAQSSTRSQIEVLRTLLGLDENWNSGSGQQQAAGSVIEYLSSMVHEINPSASEKDEGIVNSTSLEDVALSEMSDNRAQSIQSLHSVLETPTPDTTPSFDELQQRLDASNRNMQHLQDEQQKLRHIQNMAKTHLNEMEQLRQHSAHLAHNGNGDAPNYESVQQVQDDMASLVGRMKNLTAFIHNQNELSSVLGDDGPEILAEQQALQEKLESLRAQREDMRELVNELTSINRKAKERVQAVRAASQETSTPREETPPKQQQQQQQQQAKPTNERIVPVEYQRNVPILRQEAVNAAQRAQHAQNMIDQKTADIEALKAQMNRLKSMLNTVNQIEAGTSDIGETLERRSVERPEERPRDISQRVQALDGVSSELRAEAATLQQERDRISALKAEIERRQRQAAAAVQMGDEALQRHSLTPTPLRQRPQDDEQEEEEDEEKEDETKRRIQLQTRNELRAQCEKLRQEYEKKQREYEAHFMNSHGTNNHNGGNNNNNDNTNTTSEADDEGNDDTDSDRYFTQLRASSSATLKRTASTITVVEKQQQQQQQQLQQQQQQMLQQQQQQQQQEQQRRTQLKQQQQHTPNAHSMSNNEDDLNLTIDSLSLGNDSIPSSSTRSQYMPPPMAPVQGMWNTHSTANTWHSQPGYLPATPTGAPVAPGVAASSQASSVNQTPDAVLLQQFMQTQQMLINSVCQCNQTLWHQQREIDSLNSQIHSLQERLNASCQEHAYSLRSESVPPIAGGLAPNNLCLGASARAQSEQLYNFGSSHQSAFSNYQRSTHRNNIYSGSDPHQAQTYLNNAAPPPPPPPPTHYNNETPLSPLSYRPTPAPIFMNHHNNTIHQNNANLRTQNQHANNLHSLPEDAVPPPTLNNQVPPGNRANNYWDNFRSYTRQNLLSNKSNEELNVEHQYRQIQRQRQRPSYFQTHLPHTARGSTSSILLQQQQQQQQQQAQSHRHFYETTPQQPQPQPQQQQQQQQQHLLNGSSSNNLNNSSSSNHDWRNNAHGEEEDVEEEDNNDSSIFGSSGGRRRNRRRPMPTLRNEETSLQELTAGSSNFFNMNVNSPLYQRNKVPAKPTTSAVSLTPLQQRHLRFDFELPAQYMDYELPEPQAMQAPPAAPVYNVTAQESVVPEESNAVLEQGTEETASEELNRNLLVNALKNDKFTTKFYESIKEDVYRRLETLFEQQQQQQQQLQQQLGEQQLYNEVHSLRKTLNQGQAPSAPPAENAVANESTEATESGTESPQAQSVSDRPEDDNSLPLQVMATAAAAGAATASTSAAAAAAAAAEGASGAEYAEAAGVGPAPLDNDDQIIEVVIERPGTPPSASLDLSPDHELIEYIIKRIRNQTHNNTIINDSLLAEVSKLTANAAQNSAASWTPNAVSPLISPKRFYAKIKKLDVPRQRDEFLLWYRTYLEQLFVVEQQSADTGSMPITKSKELKAHSKKQVNKRVRAQSNSQDSNNDADLAEADQKKVTLNGGDTECENNENPEEEASAAAAQETQNISLD